MPISIVIWKFLYRITTPKTNYFQPQYIVVVLSYIQCKMFTRSTNFPKTTVNTSLPKPVKYNVVDDHGKFIKREEKNIIVSIIIAVLLSYNAFY